MLTLQDKERFRLMLMKAVDAELSAEEQSEFDRFIGDHSEYKSEWEEFKKLNKLTGGIHMKLPEQEKWDQYWTSIYNRLERRIGWILLSAGLIILLSTGGFYAIRGFLLNPDIPILEKLGLSAFFLGSAVLIVSVLREKLTLRKTDKYKDIVR